MDIDEPLLDDLITVGLDLQGLLMLLILIVVPIGLEAPSPQLYPRSRLKRFIWGQGVSFDDQR